MWEAHIPLQYSGVFHERIDVSIYFQKQTA